MIWREVLLPRGCENCDADTVLENLRRNRGNPAKFEEILEPSAAELVALRVVCSANFHCHHSGSPDAPQAGSMRGNAG